MQRVGKGLAAAVIGNGNCLMAPGSRLFDGSFGIGEGIHITHHGMQVQLHTLLPFSSILPLGHRAGHNGKRLQNRFVSISIYLQLTLYLKHRTNLYVLQDRFRILVFQETADTDGGCIIGHIKIDDPGISLFQFPVLHTEHTALYNHTAHIQIQLLHGSGSALKGLAVNCSYFRRFFLLLLGDNLRHID